MHEANKYVNTYIECALNQLHENVNNTLQLKTQLKLNAEAMAEKDQQIGLLMQELENSRAGNQEMDKMKNHIDQLENNRLAMSNKISHLDTALAQIVQMKKLLLEKDGEIGKLNNKIEILKNPNGKKAAGKVKTGSEKIAVTTPVKSNTTVTTTDDDF